MSMCVSDNIHSTVIPELLNGAELVSLDCLDTHLKSRRDFLVDKSLRDQPKHTLISVGD